jgi:hypothetical protein
MDWKSKCGRWIVLYHEFALAAARKQPERQATTVTVHRSV